MSTKILVTGSNGFIGKNILPSLESKGYNIFCPQRQDYDLVNEIFFKRFSNSCTWEPDLFDWFTDSLSYEDGDNEIEKLPEEIDYKKIRLKPTMK